jgi:hypothetical protein
MAAHWDRESLSTGKPAEGALSLRRLIDCAANHAVLDEGEVRLVALHDGGLGGMQVVPSASQSRRATLVVAHLAPGPLAVPRPDANLRKRTLARDELSRLSAGGSSLRGFEERGFEE